MLVAARDEVDRVNVVVLPESAVDDGEIDALEALLDRHGVIGLDRRGPPARASSPGSFPATGCTSACRPASSWVHIRQNKHHRWSLDEGQIYQYHLGGALHPHVRWWEAMEVPRRSIQFVEAGGGDTLVSLVCEDLAQIDDVADVLRSVGPTLVVTPLLDGPQLSSRWAARYASVLADDPGSAVLTLDLLRHGAALAAARHELLDRGRAVEGPRPGDRARSRSRPAPKASSSRRAAIVRPGAAPTAAGPSTTAARSST